jgi:hypothetical protein
MTWRQRHDVHRVSADDQRLHDLTLALVIPLCWPNYWLDDTNQKQRAKEILKATERESLPWQR